MPQDFILNGWKSLISRLLFVSKQADIFVFLLCKLKTPKHIKALHAQQFAVNSFVSRSINVMI